jgi:hypothetical protein
MAQTLKAELSALRLMIQQAKDNLEDIELPQGRATRCRELLTAAFALANDLVRSDLPGKAAAQLGAKGGKTTAKRMILKDPDYYKRIAAMRKTRAGGRPRKKP